MGSVADGLRPAEENDILELDERKDLHLKAVEQTVALGGSLPSDSTGRSECARGPFGQDLHAALEPDSTKPRLRGYRRGKSFSDLWKPSGATASPVFEEKPTHRQVGKSSGEMAHVERFFGRLRQKLARQVHRTRVASESERTDHLMTKLFVEWYNEAVT